MPSDFLALDPWGLISENQMCDSTIDIDAVAAALVRLAATHVPKTKAVYTTVFW